MQTENTTTQPPIDRDTVFYASLLSESKVPAHLQEGLALYLAHGIPPGSFLTAVLQNDASSAVRRADLDCRAALADIFIFLINVAPWASWGSEGVVHAWIADHQAARNAKAS